MFKFLPLFLLFPFIFSQFPTRFDSSNHQSRSDLLGNLENFREQQRKFLEENTRFNSSGFFRGGVTFPRDTSNFTLPNSNDLEERLNRLKDSIPQGLRYKCYESQEACLEEGGCTEMSDCVFCMNLEQRKTGYRCLKAEREEASLQNP